MQGKRKKAAQRKNPVRFLWIAPWFLFFFASTSMVGVACEYVDDFTIQNPAPMGMEENDEDGETLFFLLEAETETSNPYLSLESDESPTDHYQAMDVAEGAGRFPSQLIQPGERPPGVEFSLREPLSQTYYVNVTQPIEVELYWKSTSGSMMAELGGSGISLRVELFQGDQRIGGVEHVGSTLSENGWFQTRTEFFHFRSETHRLESGQTLTAKVTPLSGFTEFLIGTGSDHQSRIRISHFLQDPLGGTMYVKDGAMQSHLPQSSPSVNERLPTAQPTPSYGYLVAFPFSVLLVPVGLLSLPSASRNKLQRLGAAFVLILIAFSGCLGTESSSLELSEPTLSGPSVPDITYHSNDLLEQAAEGAIEGQVLHEDPQIPIHGAQVSLLGTDRSATTNETGHFHFDHLPPKEYALRIDVVLEGQPVSLEQEIRVELGKILQVTIYLTHSNGIHAHDQWGDATVLLHTDRSFPLEWDSTTNQFQGRIGDASFCYDGAHCEAAIPIEYQMPILPGTALVEVALDWQAGTSLPRELGLAVLKPTLPNEDAKGKLAPCYFVSRPADEPFRIAILPHEADPGHQRFTDWKFSLLARSELLQGRTMLAGMVTNLHVKVSLHKGVVPFEPAHKDFWKGEEKMVLFQNALLTSSSGLHVGTSAPYPSEYPNPDRHWALSQSPELLFIPPETQEIRGTLQWSHPAGLPLPFDWGLAFKPANVSIHEQKYFTVQMETSGDYRNARFVIPVEPEMTDQYYQSTSNWRFYPDDLDEASRYAVFPMTGTSELSVEWHLTAEAIRGPNDRA